MPTPTPAELLEQLGAEQIWDVREKALISLQRIACDEQKARAFFTSPVLRALFRPIERQLKDLRSAILREACKLVSQLACSLGDDFHSLARMLIPTMVEIAHLANKVMSTMMDDCCCTVFRHTVVRSAVPHVCEVLTKSKSKDARESCIQFIRIMLNVWEAHCFEQFVPELEDALRHCLEDASAAARITARQAYWSFHVHWPQRAARMLRRVDARTQKLVESTTEEEKLARLLQSTVAFYCYLSIWRMACVLLHKFMRNRFCIASSLNVGVREFIGIQAQCSGAGRRGPPVP